jgi:hypothetical protein
MQMTQQSLRTQTALSYNISLKFFNFSAIARASEIFPIRCDETMLSTTLADFPGKISNFPGKYLGLPLHTLKLRRVDVQLLLDKIGSRIPGWKGKLLSTAGRETLVKSVLTAQPIYRLTVFPMQKWLFKQIGRMRRSFLWKGEEPEKVSGGHCLVNWPTTCAPRDLGVWAFWTWNASHALCGYGGYGSNGNTQHDLGLVWIPPVTAPTGTFSMPQRLLQLARVIRQASGTQIGSMDKRQNTLHPPSSKKQKGKT